MGYGKKESEEEDGDGKRFEEEEVTSSQLFYCLFGEKRKETLLSH